MIAVQTTLTDTPQPSVLTAQVASTTWSQQCCPISVCCHLYAVSGLQYLLDPSINCYSDERKLIHDGGDDDDDDDDYDDYDVDYEDGDGGGDNDI